MIVAMPRDGAIIFGDPIGKLDVLNVAYNLNWGPWLGELCTMLTRFAEPFRGNPAAGPAGAEAPEEIGVHPLMFTVVHWTSVGHDAGSMQEVPYFVRK